MPNDFSKRSAEELSLVCANLLHLIPVNPPDNELHMTANERAAIVSAAGLADGAIQAKLNADQASRQASLDKAEGKAEIVLALNAVARTASEAGVAPSVLAKYGFAPRRTEPSRPTLPVPVAGVTTEAFADGTVRLAWDRMGNRRSTTFLVERSADGASWTQVGATSATKVSLDGFEPGVGTWFRIVATNSLGAAKPSPKASIYTPATPAAPMLRVA